MEKKEFEFEFGWVYYTNIQGERSHIYIGDYESENISLKIIENDFNEMLDQCGLELDAINRQSLFGFVYGVVICECNK